MARFINPFTDVGFKRIFGQEINKDLLIDFLNGLLEGEKHIVDIRFLDKEVLPAFAQDRGVIYDVYCTNESGEQFIVEMQNRPQVNFRERALYYLSRAVARQGERGADWQFRLKAVYGVFFMNFCLDSDSHKLRTDIVLSDRETHEAFSDKLRFIFLELPSFTKEDRMKYDESIKIYRDHLAVEAYAKEREERRMKEAWDGGLAKGLEKGLAEGRAAGRAEGEKEKQRQIALRMKGKGMSAEDIAELTGLSVAEVGEL